jgi:uncharacterized OB-fold protein
MDFGNFGSVSFTQQAKVVPFIEYLEQGKFMATRCKQCGKKYFPPRVDCPTCLTSDVEWFEVNEKGKLLTYTVINYGPLGFEEEAPYTLAIAEFNDGLRVLSRISKKLSPDTIRIGMEVRVVPVKLGDEKISFEFVT